MKDLAIDDVITVELPSADTHDLRRRVLRNGTASSVVVFDGDDEPSTAHIGLVWGGRIVAVSTWVQAPLPGSFVSGGSSVQLRGMATEPDLQGSGLGARLLDDGVARVATRGVDVVWANARSSALAFYLAHGFETVGDEFVEAATGLPHQVVRRRIG